MEALSSVRVRRLGGGCPALSRAWGRAPVVHGTGSRLQMASRAPTTRFAQTVGAWGRCKLRTSLAIACGRALLHQRRAPPAQPPVEDVLVRCGFLRRGARGTRRGESAHKDLEVRAAQGMGASLRLRLVC